MLGKYICPDINIMLSQTPASSAAFTDERRFVIATLVESNTQKETRRVCRSS